MATKIYHEKAPAKINLSLKVIGRRPADGYHLLEMVNAKINIFDLVTVSITENANPGNDACNVTFRLTNGTKTGVDGNSIEKVDSNLAGRAAILFCKEFNISSQISIELEKRIPIGAGLGGGSSDAACILKILAGHFLGKDYSSVQQEKLIHIATLLGADIPFFLEQESVMHVSGVGEKSAALPDNHTARKLMDKPVLVLVPEFGILTSKVFAVFRDKQFAFSKPGTDSQRWILGENDLLQSVFIAEKRFEPYYRSVKQIVPEAALSGSGSALFVVSPTEEQVVLLQKLTNSANGQFFSTNFA